jgi:hypothetical protein
MAMGILKDAGDTIAKYGEIIFNKTEELARIAKLNLDIKRFQIDQGIAEKDLGRHVIAKIDEGAASIDSSDQKVKEIHGKVAELKKCIEEKKADIEKIKAEAKQKLDAKLQSRKPEGGAQ